MGEPEPGAPPAGEGTVRTFVALPLPGTERFALAALIVELGRDLWGMKWVEEENLHLTLGFLGEVEGTRVAAIGGAMRAALAGSSAFRARLEGIGAFPRLDRPRVVWVGFAEGADEIAALAGRVRGAMEGLGIAPDPKPFTAHVTLGRLRRDAHAPPLLCRRLETLRYDGAAFRVCEAHLMKSRLTPGGPIYHPLETVRLDQPPDSLPG